MMEQRIESYGVFSFFFAFLWLICYSYKRLVWNIIASGMPFKWSESCYIDFGNQSFKGQILFLAFTVITLRVKVYPDCSVLFVNGLPILFQES